ncbi:MAG TPA: porin [Thiotrichaceae bacterium]|nr:porin [Thiotrichaceae bacterium]HIM07614.1 porin [Gammaproteobacteria bacterium]
MNNKIIAGAVAAAVIGLSPMTASAVNFKDVMAGKMDFSVGGYVKMSASYSDLSDGDTGGNSLGDVMYAPIAIPTSNGSAESESDLDFSARESRINFKASQKIDGHKLLAYIEMDFMPNGDAGGNEVISNSYSPRLRHAFLKFDNWTLGQTWTTLMDLGALPESADFLPASESTVFGRQQMIRYTSGNFQIALENPESYGVADRDDNDLPDLIANYKVKGDWGHIRLNGLLREINSDVVGGAEDSATGWGLGVTGKVMVGKDDLKFSVFNGEGLGRYIALGGGAVDAEVVNGDVELTETTAFFVAYRHWWNDKVRSSIIYSDLEVQYDTKGDKEVDSIAVNLMYSPVKNITLGAMIIHGEIDNNDGTEGELDRFLVSAKYAF